MRISYEILKPTRIRYCLYWNFSEELFSTDIAAQPLDKCKNITDKNCAYNDFKDTFQTVSHEGGGVGGYLFSGYGTWGISLFFVCFSLSSSL